MCLKINWATHQWRYIYILHIFHQRRRNRDREEEGGGVALALPHFFGKVIHFLFVIKICDKSSLHFASDASVHYNPELTPEWFDKNTLNKRFYINFIFCSTVSSCRYENISHIYLLHYSIYIHVSIHLYIIYIYI